MAPRNVDPKLLEELRAVFVDEVAVQREALSGLLVTLERETSEPTEIQRATSEAFRIAHALKGAARAIGDDALVELTHGVEEALIGVRRGEPVPVDVAVSGVAKLLDGLPGGEPVPDETSAELPTIEPDVPVTVSSAELRRMRDDARELRALLFLSEPDGVTGSAETVLARERAIERARRLSRGLQRLYAQPVEEVTSHLERNALEVGRVAGKRVRFAVEGGALRFDRGQLQRVLEALMHLVANAVDHGIERPAAREAVGKPAFGTVTLRVRHEGTHAVFTVEDDGAGLDLAALRAQAPHAAQPAFEPGVSTVAAASTVSGRGMGLDFVRRCIDELDGTVELDSTPGRGTRVSLSVPMSEGGITALLVQLETTIYAVPLTAVERVVRVASDTIESDGEGLRCVVGGSSLPTARLERVLRGEHARTRIDAHCVGVVLRGDVPRLLLVRRVLRQANIVARPLTGRLRGLRFVSASFRMPAGAVGLVLDASSIVRHLDAGGGREATLEDASVARRVLVVDDSVTTRQLVRLVLESAGFTVDTATDGVAAWARLQEQRYRAVVSDLEMPRMDGFELLERCGADASLQRVPIVILTGRDEDEARRRCELLGAAGFVQKGTFETEELVVVLEKAVMDS